MLEFDLRKSTIKTLRGKSSLVIRKFTQVEEKFHDYKRNVSDICQTAKRRIIVKDQLLSIVIITCNRMNELSKTIESCMNFCGMPYELIVVDNGSTDGTREYLNELSKRNSCIKCDFEEVNLGVSGGRNKGYSLANSDIVFFIDDDAYFQNDSHLLVEAYNKMIENPHIGALAFNIYDLKQKRFLIDEASAKGSNQVISYVGAAHMLRKIKSLNGYIYPAYLKYGAEERYASLRYAEMGYSTEFFEDVKILHAPSVHTRTSEKEIHRNVKINQFVIRELLYPERLKGISFLFFLIRLIKLERLNVKQIGQDLKITKSRYQENRQYQYSVHMNTIKKLCKDFKIKNII